MERLNELNEVRVTYLFGRGVDEPHVDVLYLPNTCNNEDTPRVNKRYTTKGIHLCVHEGKKKKREGSFSIKITTRNTDLVDNVARCVSR